MREHTVDAVRVDGIFRDVVVHRNESGAVEVVHSPLHYAPLECAICNVGVKVYFPNGRHVRRSGQGWVVGEKDAS